MMENNMGNDGNYGSISLDMKEPFAKKLISHIFNEESLKILELTKNPSTCSDICNKSPYSQATMYRRISKLVDASLLVLTKKEHSDMKNNFGWMYEKSFHIVYFKCGQACNCDDCPCILLEIWPKKEYYGKLLKTIREYRCP